MKLPDDYNHLPLFTAAVLCSDRFLHAMGRIKCRTVKEHLKNEKLLSIVHLLKFQYSKSVWSPWSSCFSSKNEKIKIPVHQTTILPLVSYRCKTQIPTAREST
jgi:hypothetical protein